LNKQTFDFVADHYNKCAYQDVFNAAPAGSAVEGRGPNTVVLWNRMSKMALYTVQGIKYRDFWKRSGCTGAYIQADFQRSHDFLAGLYPGVVIFFYD